MTLNKYLMELNKYLVEHIEHVANLEAGGRGGHWGSHLGEAVVGTLNIYIVT